MLSMCFRCYSDVWSILPPFHHCHWVYLRDWTTKVSPEDCRQRPNKHEATDNLIVLSRETGVATTGMSSHRRNRIRDGREVYMTLS
jgi:hypothetical protein